MPQPSELSSDELYAAYAIDRAMDRYGVEIDQFEDLRRCPSFIAGSRQLAALLVQEGTDLTNQEIGEIIGYKSSGAVTNAIRSAREFLGGEEAVRAEIADVMDGIPPNTSG